MSLTPESPDNLARHEENGGKKANAHYNKLEIHPDPVYRPLAKSIARLRMVSAFSSQSGPCAVSQS